MSQEFDKGFVSGVVLDQDYTSLPHNCGQRSKVAVQVDIENADAVGTLKIETSLDNVSYHDFAFRDTNDNTVTEKAVLSGVDLSIEFDLTPFASGYVRVKYTRTSGGASNLLSARILAKRD